MSRHFYRDEFGELVHESNAIDNADAELFAADQRRWAEERALREAAS